MFQDNYALEMNLHSDRKPCAGVGQVTAIRILCLMCVCYKKALNVGNLVFKILIHIHTNCWL